MLKHTEGKSEVANFEMLHKQDELTDGLIHGLTNIAKC